MQIPREPKLVSLREIGVKITDARARDMSNWIVANAKFQQVTHIHSTSRDRREYSTLRKTMPLRHPQESTPPPEIRNLTEEIYSAVQEELATYLGVPLGELVTRYAAEGHAHLPSDAAAEGHVDYYPSANAYFEKTSQGGELWIARSATARSIEEIREDAFKVTPEPLMVALFDGTTLPHFVDAIPAGARGDRTCINLTYYDGSELDVSHPRYTHARWMNQTPHLENIGQQP